MINQELESDKEDEVFKKVKKIAAQNHVRNREKNVY
jgi:hypothetical protein